MGDTVARAPGTVITFVMILATSTPIAALSDSELMTASTGSAARAEDAVWIATVSWVTSGVMIASVTFPVETKSSGGSWNHQNEWRGNRTDLGRMSSVVDLRVIKTIWTSVGAAPRTRSVLAGVGIADTKVA
ncbi:hypothetical protein B0H19DRAFT_1204167, partial [Mycena capillaripes]